MFMFIITEPLTSGSHSTKKTHVPCHIGQVLGLSNSNMCIFTIIKLITACFHWRWRSITPDVQSMNFTYSWFCCYACIGNTDLVLHGWWRHGYCLYNADFSHTHVGYYMISVTSVMILGPVSYLTLVFLTQFL